MQFSTLILAAMTGLASAALVIDGTILPAVPKWTVKNFERSCKTDDTACRYRFTIDTPDTGAQYCAYTITAAQKASQASYNSIPCGSYKVRSSWSSQFGAETAFSTLAIISSNKQIIYPAYLDSELKNGQVVSPDKSFFPQALPAGA